MKLPIIPAVRHAYVLLWRHRALHAKAIWPPIVFLVAAEFLFHKVIGNADDVGETSDALERASYWSLAAIALLWLAGLKFLLSFSISWRRHLLLGEKFDPFFFKKPFWRYLAALLNLYALCAVPLSIAGLLLALIGWETDPHDMAINYLTPESRRHMYAQVTELTIPIILILTGMLYGIVRVVPLYTAIALERQIKFPDASKTMHGNVLRYLAVWVLGMGPIFAVAWLLTLTNSLFDIDVAATPVALGESAFRQACLFIHFSLGASIGAITYQALVKDQGPETIH